MIEKVVFRHQIEFPTILYETIFGLIIYFNLDSFAQIKNSLHFIFFFTSFILVIHWWLMFEAAADQFGEETRSSALNLSLNIVYLTLINYIVQFAAVFDYYKANIFLLLLLIGDILWALIWKHVKPWKTTDSLRIKEMKLELIKIIKSDLILVIPVIALLVVGNIISPISFVLIFAISYFLYIFITFKWKIIDLRLT